MFVVIFMGFLFSFLVPDTHTLSGQTVTSFFYLIFIIVIMLNFKLPSSFLFLPFTYYPTYSLTHSPLFLLPTLTPPFDFVFNTAFHVLVYPFPYYSGHQG